MFEADLEKYLKMTDTVEAIFEAMPMGILIYINNEIKWENNLPNWNLLEIITFASSVITVTFYCITLI
jgi:hypothetical protein